MKRNQLPATFLTFVCALVLTDAARGQTINGHVLTAGGAGVQGVLIVAARSGASFTNITDAAGHYAVAVSAGAYTVTPFRTNFTFTPTSTNVAILGGSTTVDFTTHSPLVSTQAAVNITPVSATLSALVDPDQATTSVYAQYGLTTAYGNFSSTNSAGSGVGNTDVAITVNGLSNGKTYHFRIVATNRFGQDIGSDAFFNTPLGIPSATTLPATSITGSGAILNGSANPNGVNTTAWFEWGTSTNYGNSTPPQAMGNSSIATNFSQTLTGLVASTYHYRAAAATVVSTNYGADAVFTPPLFTDIGAGLPGVFLSSTAWGDYDGNGSLDFLLFGLDTNYSAVSQVWSNTGTAFINVSNAVGLLYPSCRWAGWGDYNNDGRLDLLNSDSGLWRYAAGGFTNVEVGFPQGLATLLYGSSAWGDYDNDGRPDILISGYTYTAAADNHGDLTQVPQLIPDVLWHNTSAGFTPIRTSVPSLFYETFAWGDYDDDGLLDILVMGTDTNNFPVTQIWRNTGNGFTNINAGLPGLAYGSAAWGDYDNDGRLDILLTGATNLLAGHNHTIDFRFGPFEVGPFEGVSPTTGNPQGFVTQIWRNTGNGFTNINAGLPGVWYGSAAWGDYDNDGKLDILLTGATNAFIIATPNFDLFETTNYQSFATGFVAQIWRNTGNGFSNINAGLPGVGYSSAAWGDFDNDGKLDVLLAGATAVDTNGLVTAAISQIWRNGTPIANVRPTAPSGLNVHLSGSAVVFAWNAAGDDVTPAASLSYNLRVGTAPGQGDLVGPMATGGGVRQVPQTGNAQAKLSRTVYGLPLGQPLYWSVQTVDGGFAGSSFSPEQEFAFNTVFTPPNGMPVPGDTDGDGSVSEAELDAVLANYWPYSPFLYMTNVAGLGGTNVTFALTNSVAGAFSVQYSSNLADWFDLGTALPRYLFTDTNAAAAPQRFYRLRWP